MTSSNGHRVIVSSYNLDVQSYNAILAVGVGVGVRFTESEKWHRKYLGFLSSFTVVRRWITFVVINRK